MQKFFNKKNIKLKKINYLPETLLMLKKQNFNHYCLVQNKIAFFNYNKSSHFWHYLNTKYKNPKNFLLNSSFLKLKFFKNNLFFIFKNKLKENKNTIIDNAGNYRISITKKHLKFRSNLFLKNIFKKLTRLKPLKKQRVLNIYLKLNILKKAKKPVLAKLKTFLKKYKYKNIMLEIESKKCFNGCRPLKKKRHRRKGLRIFK